MKPQLTNVSFIVLLHKCTEHQSTVHCKGSSIYKARGYNKLMWKLYKYVATHSACKL